MMKMEYQCLDLLTQHSFQIASKALNPSQPSFFSFLKNREKAGRQRKAGGARWWWWWWGVGEVLEGRTCKFKFKDNFSL